MGVVLDKIEVDKNKINYIYSYDCELSRFFCDKFPFYIEYIQDIDFGAVPKSVLAVPFVTNLLPLCWICDFDIEVEELDKSFYDSIDEIKKGFQKIYPDVELKGNIKASKLINNTYEASEKTICLFSGGVDATFTFLRHREEKPVIINVWGVDIDFDDKRGHQEVESYCEKFAADFSTDYICIKSSLRKFLDESYLNNEMYKVLCDYWWHGAQHSIGLLSVLAPYDYIHKIKTNYIASSFTQKDFDSGVKSVTYPFVDNALKIASCNMCHDGFDYARIDKIKYICEVCKAEKRALDLKVCFNYKEGKNCNKCEKCLRTIMAILVFDDNVERYGFKIKSNKAKEVRRFLDCNEIRLFNWLPIQDAYKKNMQNKNIRWLRRYKFNNLSSLRSRILRCFNIIYKK